MRKEKNFFWKFIKKIKPNKKEKSKNRDKLIKFYMRFLL